MNTEEVRHNKEQAGIPEGQQDVLRKFFLGTLCLPVCISRTAWGSINLYYGKRLADLKKDIERILESNPEAHL